jgi:hypothetical protein
MRGLKSTPFRWSSHRPRRISTRRVEAEGTDPQEKVFAAIAPDKITELKVKSQSGDVTSLKKTARCVADRRTAHREGRRKRGLNITGGARW